MIKKITVQNFFSFGNEQTIELNLDTNILVGINGSGKSNFIRILKLLQQGMNKGFEKLFSHQWGGFSSVSNLNDSSLNQIKLSFQLENEVSSVENNELAMYEISINSLGNSDYSLEECFKEEGAVGTKLVKSLKVTGKYKREIGDLVKQLTTSPSKLELLSDLKNINIYDYFNTSFTGDIRQLSPYYSETSLLADGRNLTSLLSYLNANSIKAFDKIVEELKNVNPNFKELVFATPLAGKTLLMLKEKNLDRAISVEFISDGTLRYLLLLAIFYNPNRGKIVCIDEPEAGLHPDMINGVARGIKYAAQHGTQMIIATHSPLLLNAFELDDILIFEKNVDNQTITKKISEDDFPDSNTEFNAGQMWQRGQIGGVRW